MQSIEAEAISLHIAATALDGFVNYMLLTQPTPGGYATFRGVEHRELFAARLLDFLEKVDSNMTGVTGSCVDLLTAAARTRCFDHGGSSDRMNRPLAVLRQWLAERVKIDLWLPAIDLNGTVVIARSDLLYVCGNTSKHNLSRLTGVARRLRGILEANGHPVQEVDSWLALEDFYTPLQEDVLTYYSAWLVELLTDVRWGIHEYLLPEFRRSYTSDPSDPPRYSYSYPPDLHDRFARSCYWAVMNSVRASPPFARHVAPPELKSRFLAVPCP
jgi:hypothetical protein